MKLKLWYARLIAVGDKGESFVLQFFLSEEVIFDSCEVDVWFARVLYSRSSTSLRDANVARKNKVRRCFTSI